MAHRDVGTLSLPWPSSGRRSGKSAGADGVVLAVVVILTLVGLVMVFSASAVVAGNRFQDPLYFLKRQVAWLILGFVALHLISRLDYLIWRKLAYPLLGLAILLLILVLVPSLGILVKGARRWLYLGAFSFQPAEMAKLVLVLYLATYLTKKEGHLQSFWTGFSPPFLVLGVIGALALLQPDFGSVVMMGAVTFGLMFLGGARFVHLIGLILVVLPVGFALVWQSGYRRERLLTYLTPWEDPQGSGFQMTQSFLAFGSGGPFGVGLGEGKQKLFFLPEAHTDFVLSLVGEELGFVGTASIMILFAVLVLRGMRIAARARKPFGRHLASGITLLIGFQALFNAGVATGLLPTKGMTLPLVSYGGSSLLVTLAGVGILLSVSRDRQGGRHYAR